MDEGIVKDDSISYGGDRDRLHKIIHAYETMLNRITDALVALDKDWNIIYINDPAWKIFKPSMELKGTNFWERFEFLRGTDIETNFKNTMHNQVPSTFVHHSIYGGEEKWFQFQLYPSEEGISVFILDYTTTFLREQKLAKIIQERELLIKETHHRVKNNIQLMISLIHLQAITASDSTKKELLSLQGRVASFALLHEHLYRTGSLSSLNIKEYLINLVKHIKKTYFDTEAEIEFELDIDSFEMEAGLAISTGLLVNELVTNALKYAFKEDCPGIIKISFKQEHGYKELIVSDNGEGLPPGINMDELPSLGVRLIFSLAGQLGGTVQVQSHPGTTFTIRFAAP